MIYRVVISHNQTEHILRHSTINPLIYVFDKPTTDDISRCAEHGLKYVVMQVAGNRSANRNAGLTYLLSHYDLSDDDIIEFFDGDRYIVQKNVEYMEQLFVTHGIDCVLYTCSNDSRIKRYSIPDDGSLVIDVGTLCNPFYSCGFAMKYSAVKRVMEYNNGEYFAEVFDKWGCEDQFMGLVCHQLGLRVAITTKIKINGDVGYDQQEHHDYKQSLQHYVDMIRMHNMPFRNKPDASIEIK